MMPVSREVLTFAGSLSQCEANDHTRALHVSFYVDSRDPDTAEADRAVIMQMFPRNQNALDMLHSENARVHLTVMANPQQDTFERATLDVVDTVNGLPITFRETVFITKQQAAQVLGEIVDHCEVPKALRVRPATMDGMAVKELLANLHQLLDF